MTSSPSQPVTQTLNNFMKHKKVIIHIHGCPIILNTANYFIEVTLGFLPKPTTMSFEMANAGFYNIGKQDCVRCVYKSPQCQFFKEFQGFDLCGFYDSLPDATESDGKIKQIQIFLDCLGVIQPIKAPVHKEFTTFETRLKTFDKCETILKQDTHALCEAGFYYIGNGQDDQVLCFCCSQSFKNWDYDDEPWIKHIRQSQNCNFVRLSKGILFFTESCFKEKNVPKMNQAELSQLTADHKDVSILDNSIKVNLTKRKLEHQPDPSTVPDSMLCKICFKEEIQLAFIPCGHFIACIPCAMTLDQCAICRQPYSKIMRVYVRMEEDYTDEDFYQLPCSSSQCSDEPLDTLCKVCHKEEMQAVFVPCQHIYACMKCATEMHECPVCEDTFYATMLVYL